MPKFDDDGNQTLVQTSTGIWSVTYNGENRPALWECVTSDPNTSNSNTQTIFISFDRQGRRVTKNEQRFIYNGYLQIADDGGNVYIWDPTENIGTRPLVWFRGISAAYYALDGNKNVSEVVTADDGIDAHYEYASFGAVVVQNGASSATNPWRFSSEFAEDDIATVYYNYRHYEPVVGRWLCRDPIGENGGLSLYVYVNNRVPDGMDSLGRDVWKESTSSVAGLHQRVCVDVWVETKNGGCRYKGKCYKKKGKYCISFGVSGGTCGCLSSSSSSSSSDEDADGEASEMPPGFEESIGWGSVYHDDAEGGKLENDDLLTRVSGNCEFDIKMKEYMEGLVGKHSSYTPWHQCRTFSEAVRVYAENQKKAGKKK